jgi:hypothetical protein
MAATHKWHHKLLALLGAVLIMELGIFLVVFPWFDEWDRSYFSYLNAEWDRIWASPYFKGAVSGLGLVNIFIAFSEVLRLRRFSTPRYDGDPPAAGIDEKN